MSEDETYEEEGFYVECTTSYYTYPETDTEPIVHLYFEVTDSTRDDWDKKEILQLSLLDNKIIWNDPGWEVDDDSLWIYNEFLKSPCEYDPSITIWEYFCNDWKKYHDIEFPKEQPDYSSIKL